MSRSISAIRYQAPDGDTSFIELLTPVFEDDGLRWVLCLKPRAFLGSAAIGALVRWQRRLRERDGMLVLVQAGREVRRVLRMLGLEEVLPVFETEAEAGEHLGGGKLRVRVVDGEIAA